MDLMANNNLGRELVHLRADIRKIIFHVGIRILFTALIIFTILIEYFLSEPSSNHVAKKVSPSNIDVFVGILMVAIFVFSYAVFLFSPLFHCRDSIIFYQNGIKFGKKAWTLNTLGEIYFTDQRLIIFSKTWMNTAVKNFNITYIKEVQENYNRVYFNTLI